MNFVPAEPQQIMIEHLRKVPNALCFVGLGIGKTAAILYRLNEMFLSGEAFAALIIAPLRVINLTWANEIQAWEQFRWLKWANLRTESGQRSFLNGRAHIYGINFESIPALVSLVERRKGKLPFDVQVIDECTKAKAPGSKRIRQLRKLSRVPFNIGMTGTPAPNSDRDLFGQVRLIDGGERLGKVNETFLKENFYSDSYSGYPKWEPKAGASARIHAKISDITRKPSRRCWFVVQSHRWQSSVAKSATGRSQISSRDIVG